VRVHVLCPTNFRLSSGSVLLSFTPSSDTTASEGTGSNAMEVDPSDLDSSALEADKDTIETGAELPLSITSWPGAI
jgi:hypothetical protein